MKKVIVWGVLVSLVGSSTAWAQGQGDGHAQPPSPAAEVPSLAKTLTTTGTPAPRPSYCPSWVREPWDQGSYPPSLSTFNQQMVAQGHPECQDYAKQARSDKLAAAGFFMMLAGALIALPHGDNVYVGSSTYCVDSGPGYASVDDGACSNGPHTGAIGAILAGAGLGLMIVGLQQVAIQPQITSQKKAVVATIAWGGKK